MLRLCSYSSLLGSKIVKQSGYKARGSSEGAQDAVFRREITYGICPILTLRATRHLFRSDDGLIDACGDSRLAEGVAIQGAVSSLAPDLELGLAPENKVSTLDDIF